MELVKRLLKRKELYVLIVLSYFVFQVKSYNRENHTEQLEKFYGEAIYLYKTSNNQPKKRNNDIEELITFAKNQLGKPYKYAAKGPNSFDCSGFTNYIYKKIDVNLSPSSKAQAKQGKPLEIDEIKPGDIVYFKSPTRGNNMVGHVGLVVSVEEGSIRFIHSSTNKGVIIDDLIQSNHYHKRYMGARRVL